jgi:phage terminase small subunit
MLQRGRKSAANLATLPVTGPKPAPIRAVPVPDHLSPAMQDWWTAVTMEHELDAHRLHLLQAAAEAWDTKEAARKALAKHGLTFNGKDGPRPRPECGILRDSRIAFARLVRELNLDPPPDRPGRYGGNGWIP